MINNFQKYSLALLIISITSMLACTNSSSVVPVYDCTSTIPTYTNDIKSIMDNSCAISGCHNSSSKANGKDFSSYILVKSGSSQASFLGSMEHLSGYKAMPQGKSKLTDTQLQTISCWIENGTPQ